MKILYLLSVYFFLGEFKFGITTINCNGLVQVNMKRSVFFFLVSTLIHFERGPYFQRGFFLSEGLIFKGGRTVIPIQEN